ncbi:hypothetical protein LTR84_009997 [Exophiala bonariae]|uniref:Uncharacterized protein n=1 Tax=Exophiala bonariae TaxID=1690606 RepID=A0AAV9NNN5_9EURO|nr:hypothetical protein LTR84_009997 [Exophiala bonariae]
MAAVDCRVGRQLYMKFEDVELSLESEGTEEPVTNVVIRVIVKYEKGEKFSVDNRTRCAIIFKYFESPSREISWSATFRSWDLNAADIILLLMAHSLRHGLFLDGSTLEEVLHAAYLRRDRRLRWKCPTYPLVLAIDGRNWGKLVIQKPATYQQVHSTFEKKGDLAGYLNYLRIHDMRREGGAHDLADVDPGLMRTAHEGIARAQGYSSVKMSKGDNKQQDEDLVTHKALLKDTAVDRLLVQYIRENQDESIRESGYPLDFYLGVSPPPSDKAPYNEWQHVRERAGRRVNRIYRTQQRDDPGHPATITHKPPYNDYVRKPILASGIPNSSSTSIQVPLSLQPLRRSGRQSDTTLNTEASNTMRPPLLEDHTLVEDDLEEAASSEDDFEDSASIEADLEDTTLMEDDLEANNPNSSSASTLTIFESLRQDPASKKDNDKNVLLEDSMDMISSSLQTPLVDETTQATDPFLLSGTDWVLYLSRYNMVGYNRGRNIDIAEAHIATRVESDNTRDAPSLMVFRCSNCPFVATSHLYYENHPEKCLDNIEKAGKEAINGKRSHHLRRIRSHSLAHTSPWV